MAITKSECTTDTHNLYSLTKWIYERADQCVGKHCTGETSFQCTDIQYLKTKNN